MAENAKDASAEAVRPNPYEILPLIIHRWSPRSFLDQPVSENDLFALLEAAHWAPSCFNEQPWRFLVARTKDDLANMRAVLAASNRVWADHAPVLIAVLSQPNFALDGRPNRWHAFDSGTAWGYLALEARQRGLIAHAMGGFSVAKLRQTFAVPEDWGVHAIVAVGYQGPREQLTPKLQDQEQPTLRRDLKELWCEGKFHF